MVLSGSEWVNLPPTGVETSRETPANDAMRQVQSFRPTPASGDSTEPTRPTFFEKRNTGFFGDSPGSTGPLNVVKRPPTSPLDTMQLNAVDVDEDSTAPASVFNATMMVCIEIGRTSTPLVLRLPPKRALILGRDDPAASDRPDIDLIPYGGFQLGISRRHAALEISGKRLMISDLKSSNGTFLNGERLDPHEPYQVRDGDEVRLGNMHLKISFR